MKSRRLFLTLVLAVVLPPGLTSRAVEPSKTRQPQVPDITIEKYTLLNGLQVILAEDHSTPIVGVNIWYNVGSKDEKKGRTGFAHLFEHMMFQGSKHHDDEYFGPIEKLGAVINGSTNTDRTNYFENVPSNVLERALWLEADRMGFLLPVLTQKKLDNQRDVVKNERRQRVDNQPYGQSMEKMIAALYPEDHPYHHSVIGSMADLSTASLGDVSAFFRMYYAPNNASLCIAGDFEPATIKKLVEKYFGPIPRGPEVERPKPSVPKLTENKHVVMTDRVSLARTQLVWPTVPVGHADEPALDVLASILGQLDNENRLYRALVYDKPLAAFVRAFHNTSRLSGVMAVVASPRPGQKLEEVVEVIERTIARIQADGVTDDEVLKAQNTTESGLVLGLESVGRRADFLNSNNVLEGDPLAYKADMKKLFAVIPADVKRVANQYLKGHHVRVDVNPGAPTPRAPEVAVDLSTQPPLMNPKVVEIKDEFDRNVMPEPGPTPKFAPPAVARRKLSNGLEILVAERHTLPIVTLRLVVKGGETMTSKGKEGLSGLMAGLLTEGTTRRDSLALAGALSRIGATINANAELESTSLSLTTLTKNTDEALGIYTDVLLHPAFPEKDLKRLRMQALAQLKASLDRAETIASIVFPKLVYGEANPYGRPEQGTPKSVEGLSRDDIVAFHKKLFMPNNAALIVVGDTTADAISALLESALHDWKSGELPKVDLPATPAAKPTSITLVDKPAAAQSVLAVGQVGVARSTPDYVPLTIMNSVLGGQFSSRINLNLREDKGYTYGARSSFSFRIGAGPFEARTSVQTAVTKESLHELMKELVDITGSRPITQAELEFAKGRVLLGFPNGFETAAGVAGKLSDLVVYGLPDNYYVGLRAQYEAVAKADVDRVSKQYLDPSHMTILIVGDRSRIEAPLRSLSFGASIRQVDAEGKPVSDSDTAGH